MSLTFTTFAEYFVVIYVRNILKGYLEFRGY